MAEHELDEFGKRTPTNTTVGIVRLTVGAAMLWGFAHHGGHADVPDNLFGWVAPL